MDPMGKKVLIIRHTDRDGIVAAATIRCALRDGAIYAYDNKEVMDIGMNYDKPLSDLNINPECYDMIYLVDYSISTFENVKCVLEWTEWTKVIWLDHHASSIKIQNKYPELKDIRGYRINGISGAALAWIWSTNEDNFPTYGHESYFDQRYLNDPEYVVPPNIVLDILEKENCPDLIIYTHRYDIWDHSPLDMRPVYFHYGYNPRTIDDVDYRELLYSTDSSVDDYIEDGEERYNAIMKENESILKECGRKFTLETPDKNLRGIAINRPRGSSLMFGTEAENYDILCVFYFAESKWRVSLYTVKDYINCEEICIKMGGGGHRKAAGFTIDHLSDLPWVDKDEYIFKVK